MKMKRRAFIRIISFSTIAIIALTIFGVYNFFAAQTYRRYITYNYLRGFSDLTSHINEIDTSLQKSIYATTPKQFISLSNTVWRSSGAAQTALEQLPIYDANLQELSTFLSQTGDYSYALAKRLAENDTLTLSDEEKVNIARLSETASGLSNYLTSLQSEINDGRITLTEIKYTMVKKQQVDDGQDVTTFTGNMVKAEEQIGDTPSLIYDGPYSEHIEKRTPKFIEGKAEISREQAKATAAALISADPSTLIDMPDTEDKIPTYNFSLNTFTISVTKMGGVLYEMTESREIKEPTLSIEQASEKAKAILLQAGFKDMKESYYVTDNNKITFNFAATQGDVVIYPDLVKVSIALDDGTIAGFSATGYIMSHTAKRDISVTVSVDTARKLVSKELTIESNRLTIIPSDGENEILCHEFRCISPDNKIFLVYVGAKSGDVEDMLILLETPGGVLTM